MNIFSWIRSAQSIIFLNFAIGVPSLLSAPSENPSNPFAKLELSPGKGKTDYSISHRPWDVTPVLKNVIETKKVPGWIDPLPHDPEVLAKPFRFDIAELLQRPFPKTLRQPISPIRVPKLPWFDLNLIPKAPVVEQKPEDKVLTPMIAGSFAIDGRIAIFKTTDEHLYYVVPNRWLVSLNGLTVDRPKDEGKAVRLRFLLSPSYAWADELIGQIRAEDPLAFFVPIPKRFVGFHLDVPGIIGDVKNQILPTDSMSIGDQIYMNIELDEEQLEVFRILSESKTFVTGSVRFSYPYDAKTDFQLASDIWLNFQGI